MFATQCKDNDGEKWKNLPLKENRAFSEQAVLLLFLKGNQTIRG